MIKVQDLGCRAQEGPTCCTLRQTALPQLSHLTQVGIESCWEHAQHYSLSAAEHCMTVIIHCDNCDDFLITV